ncbi:hypothetical protein ABZ470_19650 [Streptosporangium sp. NPDC020072]|uniref:hypothetical protein n=1 Tax=Streptosporangium sp. NPDC020072 TaxID=3154788 RepID=UPI00341F9F74
MNADNGLGDALRRSVGTRTRRRLVTITLLAGVAAAVGMSKAPPAGRTFAMLTEAAQSLMSITVPFLGVLLTHDLRRTPRTARLAPTLLAATLLAAAFGVFGALTCALALILTPAVPGANPWLNVETLVLGGVLVQVVAQLTGTALGLLLRSPVVACLGTIVLPMGLWLVLRASPVQGWLAPYATARNLLSGQMTPLAWLQWGTVLLIWGVGLNAVGAARLRRVPVGSGSAS